MQHPAPRQVMSSLAPKPTKDFEKEIQQNLWHRRKVRKSDSFSHLFSVSMVSAFDSSHMQRVHQSLLEPGVCPICIMSKLADPLKQRKAAFWGAREEHKPSYRPRRSQTLISLSQIRAPAIPVLFSHSFYQDGDKEKGHRRHWRNRIRAAGPDGARDSWMDEWNICVRHHTRVFCCQCLWCFWNRILMCCWRSGHPNRQNKYANLSKKNPDWRLCSKLPQLEPRSGRVRGHRKAEVWGKRLVSASTEISPWIHPRVLWRSHAEGHWSCRIRVSCRTSPLT